MVFNDEIVNMMNIKIEEYYICYFDILGYREYMESNPAQHKSFLVNLEAIVAKVQKLIQENCNGFGIQYRTYSDNFLLFSKVNLHITLNLADDSVPLTKILQ